MQIMDPVEFELIRQAEKANLTKEEEKEMHDWIISTEVSYKILGDIINGDMEIAGMGEDGEPLIKFTPQGLAKARSNEDLNEDSDEEFDDDFDEEDFDEYCEE